MLQFLKGYIIHLDGWNTVVVIALKRKALSSPPSLCFNFQVCGFNKTMGIHVRHINMCIFTCLFITQLQTGTQKERVTCV